MKVCVVGGGIVGLTSALYMARKVKEGKDDLDDIQVSKGYIRLLDSRVFVRQITVVSEKMSPWTTGDVAAGIWGPFLIGGDDLDRQR